LGSIYERYKTAFFQNRLIKSVDQQEDELKRQYVENRDGEEKKLNKEYLKKLNEKMKDDNNLICMIDKCQQKEFKGMIDTRLKPIQHLTFVFGEIRTQDSKPDNLELKQVMQKKQ